MHHVSLRSHHHRRTIGCAVTAAAAVLVTTLPLAPGVHASAGAWSVAAPSGQTMPTGDLDGWRQTFTDDFTTDVPLGDFPATVSTKWGAYPSSARDTSGYGRYSPTKVVSIAGGLLNSSIRTEGGVPLISALLPKVPGSTKSGQTYGRYSVRFRYDRLPGYKMAWMLWPDSNARVEGEIDFAEMNLDSPNAQGFVHPRNRTSSSDQAWAKAPIDNTWHTTVIEWSPNLVVFQLDGREIGRSTDRIPNSSFHWVLQTEVALTTGTPPPPSVRGNVQVDWVAAWAYDPAATEAPPVTTPPGAATASLTAPDPAVVWSGTVGLTASATDPAGIIAVKWYVDGIEVAHDGDGAAWSRAWSTTGVSDGPHKIFVKARSASGTWITSRSVAFTVRNAG